jgi:hypothetical protein
MQIYAVTRLVNSSDKDSGTANRFDGELGNNKLMQMGTLDM